MLRRCVDEAQVDTAVEWRVFCAVSKPLADLGFGARHGVSIHRKKRATQPPCRPFFKTLAAVRGSVLICAPDALAQVS